MKNIIIVLVFITSQLYGQVIINHNDSIPKMKIALIGDPQPSNYSDSSVFSATLDSIKLNLTPDWLILMGDQTDSDTSGWSMIIEQIYKRDYQNITLAIDGNHDNYQMKSKTYYKNQFLLRLPAVSNVEDYVYNSGSQGYNNQVLRYTKYLGNNIEAIFFDITRDSLNSGSSVYFFDPDTLWLSNKADSLDALDRDFFIVTHPQLFYSKDPGLIGEGITSVSLSRLVKMLKGKKNFLKLFVNGHAHRYQIDSHNGFLFVGAESNRRGTGVDIVVPYIEVYDNYIRLYQYLFKGARRSPYLSTPVLRYQSTIYRYTFLNDSFIIKYK